MKHSRAITGFAAIAMLGGCMMPAQQQQPGYGYGGQQPGYGQQSPYGQQPYPYPNQQPTSPMASVLGMAAELALASILSSQLGITSQQAAGGVGSMFAVAQQRMSPDNFARLSNAVPGMNQYLAAAAPLGMGQYQNNALGSLAMAVNSFQSLGMNPSMIGQFVPVMLQYVQNNGGNMAAGLLQNAWR